MSDIIFMGRKTKNEKKKRTEMKKRCLSNEVSYHRFSNAILFLSSSHICAIVQCVLLSIHNEFIIKMFRTKKPVDALLFI